MGSSHDFWALRPLLHLLHFVGFLEQTYFLSMLTYALQVPQNEKCGWINWRGIVSIFFTAFLYSPILTLFSFVHSRMFDVVHTGDRKIGICFGSEISIFKGRRDKIVFSKMFSFFGILRIELKSPWFMSASWKNSWGQSCCARSSWDFNLQTFGRTWPQKSHFHFTYRRTSQ